MKINWFALVFAVLLTTRLGDIGFLLYVVIVISVYTVVVMVSRLVSDAFCVEDMDNSDNNKVT